MRRTKRINMQDELLIEDDEKSFFLHLEELRSRLIKILIAVVVFCVPAFFLSESFLIFITHPLDKFDQKIHFFAPHEAFILRMSAMLVLAVLMTSPFILFQIKKFIDPALHAREKKAISKCFWILMLLFIPGAAFAYFVVLPLSLRFLLSFSGTDGQMMLSAASYFSYFLSMIIAFSCLFEWPAVSYVLIKAGVLKARGLKEKRPFVIAGAFIVGAILTPPDILSQFLFAIPFLLLYEVSILIAAANE